MASSKVHTLARPGFWARTGNLAGQGLAESIPKEAERLRLAQGLKELGQNKDQDPFDTFAGLITQPGITAQGIQTGGELLKQRALGNAYGKVRGGKNNPTQTRALNAGQPSPSDVNFGGINPQNPNVSGNAAQPGIVNTNPLRQEALPQQPWTPEQRDERIGEYLDSGFTPDQAVARAADDETRELAVSPAQRARDEYVKGVQTEVKDKFKEQLLLKLEKDEKGVFKDITGDNIAAMQRGMERDLSLNPRATVDSVVNDWTQKALDLAKDKSKLKSMEDEGGISRLFHSKENMTRLENLSKRYKETGNSEELFNKLKSDGFGMSAPGAATIAYPLSKSVKEYTGKLKQKDHRSPERINSAKYADDIANVLKPDDSLLTIAREIKRKDPFFNVHEFIKYFSDNQDIIGLTPLQRRDLEESPEDIIPNWGDLTILPWR